MTVVAGFDLYGGATITRAVDGNGAEYIGCCARKLSNNVFGFYIFRNNIELPYVPFQTGRGTLNNDGHWIAWTDKTYATGAIPGFVPITAAQGPAGPQGAQGEQGPAGDGALAGVGQHQSDSIEVGGSDAGVAYIDLSAGDTDYGLRLIRWPDGHSEIVHSGAGPLVIVVNGRRIVLE